MLLTENRCCSCCYMTVIFNQILISARATSDANNPLIPRNESFFNQESSNFFPQVPTNHRMHPDQAVQHKNQYEEEEEKRDLMRTYFDNYKAFESQLENQDSINQILIGQSSFALPSSTHEKFAQSKKRQFENNNFIPSQTNDQHHQQQQQQQLSENKSNQQQVSKWSIAFNEEPHHSVIHPLPKRISLPVATTTLSYFDTTLDNRLQMNDSSSLSPMLSSAVHFDDEYDHERSQSQSVATVATPRSGSQDSESENQQQQQLKQAQRALEQSLALQDRLVKLLNRAKSSPSLSSSSSSSSSPSPLSDQSSVGDTSGQQLSNNNNNNESHAISSLKSSNTTTTVDSKKTASPTIKVDNLISLKQSDEMMRGIVPISRFVQRPKNRLSGNRYSNHVNHNTINQLLTSAVVDGDVANPQLSIDIVEPKTKLKFNDNVADLNTRFSAKDNSGVSSTTLASNLLNRGVSQFSSLADVMTMKQPVAVTRVSSREEQPSLVVTAPTAAINHNHNHNSNGGDDDDDDLRPSDRYVYGNQDKFQVDSTTTTPTNWIATHNQVNQAKSNNNNNNNKNHVMNRENLLAGSLAQPSSNLNDLVELEKFYNPKFGGIQTLRAGKTTTATTTNNNQDLFDFVDVSKPSKTDQLIDFDHNEFDQIFNNVANNERAKQSKKSNNNDNHYSPIATTGLGAATVTNIDHQNNYNNPESDLNNNNNNINGEFDFNPVQQRFERQRQQQQLAFDDWPTSGGGGGAATREADLVEQPVSSYSNIGYNNKLGNSNNQAYDNDNNDNTNHLRSNNNHHHNLRQQQLNYRDKDIVVDEEDYPSTSSHQQQQPRKRNRLKKPHLKPKHSISAQNKAFYDRRNKRLFYEYQSPTTPNHLLGGVSLTYQPSVAQGSYALSSSDGANYNTDGSPSYQVVHVHSKAEKKSHGKYLWPIVGGGLTMLMGFLIISNILLSIPLLAIGASSLFNQGGQHSQQLVPVYNLSQLITTQRPATGKRRRRRRRRRRRSTNSEGVGINFRPKPIRLKHRRRRDISSTTKGRVNDKAKNDLELRIERFIDGIVKSSSIGASRLLSGFGFGFGGWNRRQLLKAAYCHWPNRIRQQYGG